MLESLRAYDAELREYIAVFARRLAASRATGELRRDLLKLVLFLDRSGWRRQRIADELGASSSSVRRWIREAQEVIGDDDEPSSSERAFASAADGSLASATDRALASSAGALVPVSLRGRVVAEHKDATDDSPDAATVSLTAPDGWRLDGLSLEQALHVVRSFRSVP